MLESDAVTAPKEESLPQTAFPHQLHFHPLTLHPSTFTSASFVSSSSSLSSASSLSHLPSPLFMSHSHFVPSSTPLSAQHHHPHLQQLSPLSNPSAIPSPDMESNFDHSPYPNIDPSSSSVLLKSSMSAANDNLAPGNQDSDHLHDDESNLEDGDNGRKKSKRKRKKVATACVFCRRSHMTCDEGRPCQRCIKRDIGHLCHDEPPKSSPHINSNAALINPNSNSTSPQPLPEIQSQQFVEGQASIVSMQAPPQIVRPPFPIQLATIGQFATLPLTPLPFASEHMINEFTVISDFLENFDSLNPSVTMLDPSNNSGSNPPTNGTIPASSNYQESLNNEPNEPASSNAPNSDSASVDNSQQSQQPNAEKFLLAAADPTATTTQDRLKQVINAKYEAGYLRPYNYVSGYSRLQTYMEQHMSPGNRQRILNAISTFRPSFRAVAQSLTDIDLVLVEESFERLLLDYDRVFSSMGIPSCLWRRTGEIYKANPSFSRLVNIPIDKLRDGQTTIYEIMVEESAVNYWEKYGNIAFDKGQKAVLTGCSLKVRDSNQSSLTRSETDTNSPTENPDSNENQNDNENGNNSVSNGKENQKTIQCCFSFTIRRDKYNIPTMIVGNFLPSC